MDREIAGLGRESRRCIVERYGVSPDHVLWFDETAGEGQPVRGCGTSPRDESSPRAAPHSGRSRRAERDRTLGDALISSSRTALWTLPTNTARLSLPLRPFGAPPPPAEGEERRRRDRDRHHQGLASEGGYGMVIETTNDVAASCLRRCESVL